MKQLKRIMTVALSLVLCASLVAPSFAGTFAELRDIIGETEDGGTVKLEEDYSSTQDDDVSWIQIYKKSITLDLNGHTLKGDERSSVIRVIDGSLTLEDSSKGSGLITGGTGGGGGVSLNGGDLTMKGGTISGNSAAYGGGGVLVQNGTFTMKGGTISDNEATYGGGVFVTTGGTFIMNGGTISGNEATNDGGGVYNRINTETEVNGGEITGNKANQGGGMYVYDGSKITVNNGTISDNEATYGGGVLVNKGGSATVTGGEISGNSATNGGGVYVVSGGLAVTGGEITGNDAAYGGGIYNASNSKTTMSGGSISGNTSSSYAGGVYNKGTFTMESGKLYGNEANKGGDDIWNVTGATITLPNAGSMGAGLDGKEITGWYNDYSGRWGDTYDKMGSIQGYTGQLLIKAAHDEYFTVTDKDGNVLAEVEKGTEITLPTPDEREGYKFLGWIDENGEPVTTVTVDKAITLVAQWEKIESEQPIVTPDEPDHSDASDVEIGTPAVPLASGPITRAQFIDYLWRHEGEPESAPCTFIDVAEDHEYVLALGWAQSIGIISGDTFEPDELVTVAAARNFLTNFALYNDIVMPELTTLVGDEDEAVLNCGEVLAEFFDEELAE